MVYVQCIHKHFVCLGFNPPWAEILAIEVDQSVRTMAQPIMRMEISDHFSYIDHGENLQ